MLNFYHYTSYLRYQRMKLRRHFDEQSGTREGIIERGRAMIAPIDRYGKRGCISYNQAIFGLTEPEPESWWRELHPTCAPALEVILNNWYDVGGREYEGLIVLLEISVDEDDPVYVADWGVHLKERYKQGYSKEIKKEYADSLVPLRDYTADMNYCLPEVVCFQDIPLRQARLVTVDNAIMLTSRMREKYGWKRKSDELLADLVPEYSCPLSFE